MLTFRIEWPSDFGPNYSGYTGYKYVVSGLNDGCVKLLIIHSHESDASEKFHDITLGPGSRVYVMNANGATVDKIYVPHTQPVVAKPVIEKAPRMVKATPIGDAPWDHGDWS